MNDDNFKYDELLYRLSSSRNVFQEIKRWQWYSSLEVENGFDIIVKGKFNAPQFISFIHCQNVPLTNIRILNTNKNEVYELKTFQDYKTYKTLQ